MSMIGLQILIMTLIVIIKTGHGWTSFKETCKVPNQIYADDYKILSNNAESGLHCAIISEFLNCRTCLFVLSAKTCVCIYQTENATAVDLTSLKALKSSFSNKQDTTKHYVLNKPPPTGTCINSNYDWIPEVQICLRIFTTKMTYASAISKCSNDGAHVLMLKTKEKTRALYRYLVCKGMLSAYWLGIGDQQKEGLYKWIDGSPAQYIDWYPTEPSAGPSEDCVRLQYRKELKQYSWLDIYCISMYNVLCEE